MATKKHEKARKGNALIVFLFVSFRAFLWPFLFCLPVAADEAPGPVVVDLRPHATAAGRTVTLADVAELRGGNDLLREQIARLDLTELPRTGSAVAVKRAQVEYRLRLADIPPALFRLTGASEVTVASKRQAVSGQFAKRSLPPGQVIAAPDGPLVVRTKQAVKMVVRLGPVNVIANGEALQDGRVGQMVRVQNVESKKVVTGRVSGPGMVEVEAGGVP